MLESTRTFQSFIQSQNTHTKAENSPDEHPRKRVDRGTWHCSEGPQILVLTRRDDAAVLVFPRPHAVLGYHKMNSANVYLGFGMRKSKKVKIVVTDQRSGKPFTLKIRKNKPIKCSTAKRICIVCRSAVLHKNSNDYESKCCKTCKTDAHPGCQPSGPVASRSRPTGKGQTAS